jgi:hypothetical protein
MEEVVTTTDLREMSHRMLCHQAKFVIAYLERAIHLRQTKYLPKVVEDLEQICGAIERPRMNDLAHELTKAAALENWNAIQLLRLELIREFDDDLTAHADVQLTAQPDLCCY